MKKTKELIKNTVILFIGKAFTQLLSLLMLPIYTSVLGATDYGVFDLIITYTALAVPIIGFQIESGVFRYLIDNRGNKNNTKKIITNSLIALTPLIIISTLFFLIISTAISLNNGYLILLLTISTLLLSYAQQVARGLGDNIGFAIGSIITGVTNVILSILALYVLNLGLRGILIATIISNAIGIIFFICRDRITKNFSIKYYDKKILYDILKYCLPLIPNNIIWWVISVSDRTIIAILMNLAANGIYAVSNKFPHILIQVYGIFNLSWTESASLHINDDDRDEFFSNTFNTTMKTFTCMSLLMLAFMPIIFKIMVGEGYNEAYLYIPVLAIGMIFNIVVSFLGAIYIAKKKTKEVAITSFWSGVLNIVINVVLIKVIGIWAAALSTLLAFLIMSIFRYFDVQKFVKLKLDKKLASILLLLTGICVALYYVNNVTTIAVNMTITTVASLYLNRGVMKTLLKTIKTKFLN